VIVVHHQLFRLRLNQPLRHRFARFVPAVAVVISRAHQQQRLLPQLVQIFFDHRNLHSEIESRPQIEQISADAHHIELRRLRQQPVKLLQRIMQVRDKQKFHARRAPSRPTASKSSRSAAPKFSVFNLVPKISKA
jgi:hypothetical protein